MAALAPHTVQRSVVHRPNDSGIDLPPGKSASELEANDYRPVEIDADADTRRRERPSAPSRG